MTDIKTIGTLFTGGGGFDIGARSLGVENVWGVELDPRIADHTNNMLEGGVKTANVLYMNPNDFEYVDWLHASPPCQTHSVANRDRGETENDILLAHKVGDFIRVLKPKVFSLENVWRYHKSEAADVIYQALWSAGYAFRVEHLDAADFGVPQRRKRMILRAKRGGLGMFGAPQPMEKTHDKHVGWYWAVMDILDTFPETTLADWQVERLKASGEYEQVFSTPAMIEGAVGGARPPKVVQPDEPAPTVVTGSGCRVHRIVMVRSGNPRVFKNSNSDISGLLQYPLEVAPTVRSTRTELHRVVNEGCVVSITPRAFARFQTFPDWYELPEQKTLAVRIIGNAVPCLFARAIMASIIQEKQDDTD